MLGVGFFFFRQISTFHSHIDRIFFLSFKKYCCTELQIKKEFTCDFFRSVMGSKDSHWAKLGQLTSDMFRAINPLAEINPSSKLFQIG